MRALALSDFGAAPALREDLPAPAPAGEELLVRVRASSANPVDNAVAGGVLRGMLEHRFPVVLGRDYAGVVQQVGARVTGYREGDEVYGFVPLADPEVHAGGWADAIVVPEPLIAHAPSGVGLASAGAAPLVGITAMLAIDALELSAGDAVLIVGATGGVGSLAVQLAAQAGAQVIAPALPEDATFLRGLGVDVLLDRDEDTAREVRARHPAGVSAMLDLVSVTPDAFAANAAALAPGGRGASPNNAAGDGPGRANVMAVSTTESLERLARTLASGTVAVPIERTYGLDRAGDALEDLASRHTQGKLAISLS